MRVPSEPGNDPPHERPLALFRALFEGAPGSYLALAPGDFEILAVSDLYLTHTGHRREDLLGRRLFEVFPDRAEAGGRDPLRVSLDRVEATRASDVLGANVYPGPATPGGPVEERWWSIVNTPVSGPDGTLLAIIHRVEDVTEIVRGGHHPEAQLPLAEDARSALDLLMRAQELRAANARLVEQGANLRTAQRLLGLGWWRFDLASQRIIWSDEMYAIFGVRRESFGHDVESMLARFHPDDREAEHAAFRRFAAGTAPTFEFRHRIVTDDGRVRHVRGIGERTQLAEGPALVGVMQDITDLVETEARAQSLAQRLEDTLEGISDGFLVFDRDWRFCFLNREAECLLGRTRAALLKRVVWDEFPEAADSGLRRTHERALATGHGERFIQFDRQGQRWLEFNVHPNRDGVAVHFRDITDAHRQNRHLHLLEAAVARQNDMLVITEAASIDNPDGPRIVYVNDAFVRQTGFSREEVLGKTPRVSQGPGTQPEMRALIRTALQARESVRVELINYRRDGSEYWSEVEIAPIIDERDRLTHFVAVKRDITARKATEAALLESEQRFRLVTRATNDVIFDWDIVADRLWWSEAGQRQFGFSTESVSPVADWWRRRIHPEDRERVERSLNDALAGRATHWRDEYRLADAEGSYRTVVDQCVLVRDSDGKALRAVGSINDVTMQRDMEARLQQSQRFEAMGRLTSGIAHDFNNLLTVILGNAEMLAEQLGDRPDLAALVRMIGSAASQGAELTARLLAFARKQLLSPRVLDVNARVRDMLPLLHRSLTEAIELKIDLADGLWPVRADPAQLESALLNLAINARHAMPGGGVLEIRTRNEVLAPGDFDGEGESRAGDHVAIAVTDDGHGMTPEVQARAFEPFFTTKDVGHGSGLGLSMVYGFVRQSGGQVRIASAPGCGTCITLWLPRANDAS
jgi:PAS domain S-box-containing protein